MHGNNIQGSTQNVEAQNAYVCLPGTVVENTASNFEAARDRLLGKKLNSSEPPVQLEQIGSPSAVPPMSGASVYRPINRGGIPKPLLMEPRWINWREKKRENGKPTKVPLQTKPGGPLAKSNDPRTWSSFDDAMRMYSQGGCDGIGFCLSNSLQLSGEISLISAIDLDHCFDENDKLKPWAQEIVGWFPGAFVERSPRDGLHIWVLAQPISSPRTRKWVVNGISEGVEFFDPTSPRYVTVTGVIFQTGEILDQQDGVDRLCEKYKLGRFAEKGKMQTVEDPEVQSLNELTREEEIKKLRDAARFLKDFAKLRENWVNIALAMKHAGMSFELFHEFCQTWPEYESAQSCLNLWEGAKPRGDFTLGTLYREARMAGWQSSGFGLNDIGNAQRLVAYFGDRIRWFRAEKSWLIWDGPRWKPDDKEQITAYAKKTSLIMVAEAIKSGDDRLVKHAAKSAQAKDVASMIQLAKPDLAATPNMLDADQYRLNCLNATVDLRTGESRPHRQDDLITKLAPVNYNPNAPAPRFIQFLSEIFEDPELITFVQRALGYSLTGSTKEQVLFICHGGGANGKSTLFGIVREVLGDYAQETDPALLTANHQGSASEGVYRLRGVRFATTIETEEGSKLNEVKVKQLTGGDRLTARPLYGHFCEFDPSHKLWLVTNHLPEVKSQGEAIWRRIRLIPFNAIALDPDKDKEKVEVLRREGKCPLIKDKDLPETLRAEAEGILAWMVSGCVDWCREGLTEPPQVLKATLEFKQNEDSLAQFISERCYQSEEASVQASALRAAYDTWCRMNGELPLNKKGLPARLRERGFQEKETNRGKEWIGIGLTDVASHGPINWD